MRFHPKKYLENIQKHPCLWYNSNYQDHLHTNKKGMFSLDTIIPQNNINEKRVNYGINNYFNDINLSKVLRKSNILKLKGASCNIVFQAVFVSCRI